MKSLTLSADASVRAAAIVSLGKLNDESSLDLATTLLLDSDLEVRRASLLALGLLTSGSSSWLLMNIADDSRKGRSLVSSQGSISTETRGTALLSASLRSHSSAGALLTRMLDDREDLEAELLALVADSAGLLGSPDSNRILVEIAFDRSLPQFVRSAATSALGRIGDPSVTPALVSLLDMEIEPRRAAATALGYVAHPTAVREISRLARMVNHDDDAPSRQFAAIALGRIGGSSASESLITAFEQADDAMRPWLALALGMAERGSAGSSAPEALMRSLPNESNPETIAAILIGLGLSRSEASLGEITRYLEHRNVEVAGAAACALGFTGHPSAASELRRVLATSDDSLMLQQAAMSLGILGDGQAIPTLIELIRTTRSPFVASYAALGIAFMGDSNAAGPLLSLIEKNGTSGIATTYAVVAIGQLFDSDRRPALSRLASGDNYMARSSTVDELLDLGF
ncbi:MAG: HEAT repeat domain-containing protein [Planctomycetota bacterium]